MRLGNENPIFSLVISQVYTQKGSLEVTFSVSVWMSIQCLQIFRNLIFLKNWILVQSLWPSMEPKWIRSEPEVGRKWNARNLQGIFRTAEKTCFAGVSYKTVLFCLPLSILRHIKHYFMVFTWVYPSANIWKAQL